MVVDNGGNMEFPFKENIKQGIFERTFSQDVDNDELVWHRDREDREAFVIFNPTITILDDSEQGFWEGCLSVPGLRGFVERPRKIRVDFLDENAEPRSVEVENFLATVFQHELDHLVGKLYVDRMKDITTLMFEDEMIFEELEEEILD